MRIDSRIAVAVLLSGSLPWFSGCTAGVDAGDAGKFQAALEAFAKATQPEDFLRSAALYQEIIDRGVRSGPVFYNQGNAYMRAGQRGRAIAAYRQAQRYMPREPRLQANLRNALGGNSAAGQGRPTIEWVLFWQNWISYPGKFHLAAVAAAVTFVLATLGLFRFRPRLLRRLTFAGLALVMLLGISAGYDVVRFRPGTHGVVVAAEVVARKGPAETFQPAFTRPLTEGTEFRLVERRNKWLLVRLSGSEEGWIERQSAVVY